MKKRFLIAALVCLLVLATGATAFAEVITQEYSVQIRNQVYSSSGAIVEGCQSVADVNSNAYFDTFVSGIPYKTRVYVGSAAVCDTMNGWTGATRTAPVYDAYTGANDVYTYKPWFQNTAHPGELCYIQGVYQYCDQ